MRTEPTEVRNWQFQVRDLSGPGNSVTQIHGQVARYDTEYDLGKFTETLRPSVFTKSIQEAAAHLPLLVTHDATKIPVGKATKWVETADGALLGTWDIDTRDEAQEVARLVQERYLGGLSVGFAPIRDAWSDRIKPHVDRLEARLFETSLTATPAYPDGAVLAVRSAGPHAYNAPETPNLDAAVAWLESIRRR